jgi:hypothetical protein
MFPPMTAGEEMNLCPTERFVNEPSAASCTGALVGPDLVLTAGHCTSAPSDCENMVFGFDYLVDENQVLPGFIPTEKVYFCKEIVSSKIENGLDYAFVRLDREVRDRKPLRVSELRPARLPWLETTFSSLVTQWECPQKQTMDSFVGLINFTLKQIWIPI